MEPATLDGLLALTQTELPLSEAAKALLRRDTITIRVIDRGTLGCFFPLAPDEVLADPPPPATLEPEARTAYLSEAVSTARYEARRRAWLRTAPEDARIAHRLAVERVKFHTIAHATVEPRLTLEEAERLAGEADDIYVGILRFSGLAKKEAAEPELTSRVDTKRTDGLTPEMTSA